MPVIIGLSVRMEYITTKLLPILIGSIAFILAGIGLAREIRVVNRQRVTEAEGETITKEKAGEGLRGYLLTGAWVLGFFLAIYLLGFLIAMPLFVLTYMKTHGTRWLTTIILTILTPLFIYGLFELALGITLYRGLLFRWLG